MPKPTIISTRIYGKKIPVPFAEARLLTGGQYLLMQAGIREGTYSAQEFIRAINSVSFDEITKEERKEDVIDQRIFLSAFAQDSETVTLKNFQPDRARLEAFVNITFDEMYDQLSKNISSHHRKV